MTRAEPLIFRPFSRSVVRDLARHVHEVRRLYDWPGVAYHDACEAERFNRWHYHNPPVLVQAHHTATLIGRASRHFRQNLRPSYAFLSMYGRDGVCPLHTDRPQCYATVDYMVSTDAKLRAWPLYIDGVPYELQPGEAVLYSGTGQPHYRNPLDEDSDATFANLAFFHFVDAGFMGERN